MKALAYGLTACLIGGAALAQTTVIEREGGTSTTIVRERPAPPDVVVRERTESTGAVGCSTTSVTRTNEDGDTTKKTKTEC